MAAFGNHLRLSTIEAVSAISKPINAKEDFSIMWDAGSCYNILQYKSHITELTPYHQTVVGLAGKRQITHRGLARPYAPRGHVHCQ